MVDIGEEFKSQVPKATIDGKVGRHLQEALSIAIIQIIINHQIKSF